MNTNHVMMFVYRLAFILMAFLALASEDATKAGINYVFAALFLILSNQYEDRIGGV